MVKEKKNEKRGEKREKGGKEKKRKNEGDKEWMGIDRVDKFSGRKQNREQHYRQTEGQTDKTLIE